jgi:hypothetical protein
MAAVPGATPIMLREIEAMVACTRPRWIFVSARVCPESCNVRQRAVSKANEIVNAVGFMVREVHQEVHAMFDTII